ncbi:MAG: chromosome segregation protein SMC [Thermodesulfovibrionales bacterium]
MRIEKLELIGFKSFADKISFSLHPGITCIVGPNGCGKSNIVDAFRWVLGEQSAKSLRGEKMEEVIFNGSASKKQKGMAEVTLVISGLNPGGENGGNGAGDHLTVTRRLFRSGESEYMINKQACRLKDIKDVFLDTGLDAKSYSILEQGRIGAIINSKPLERRFVIEEVAGVMKYKVRKAEALAKLESSRQNLARVSDIIVEVKKQINILDRLAKKAERYKKLLAELHAIELKLARREYQQITDAVNVLNEEFGVLKEREAVLGAEIGEVEARTEARRVTLLEKEKELEAVQQSFQQLEKEIAEIERMIAVSRNDITNQEEYHNRLLGQGAEIEKQVHDLTARIEDLSAASERITAELETLADVLREKADLLRSTEDSLSEKEEQIEDVRKDIFRVTEEISRERNEVGRHQAALESLARRETVSRRDVDDARRKLAEIEASITAAESEIMGRNHEARLLDEKREVLGSELGIAKERLEDASKKLADAREELASATSRMNSLKELVFDKTTRDILAADPTVRIIAAVSDVFTVSAEYEKAIESALADKAGSLIVGSDSEIEHAAAALHGKSFEKTAFITSSPPPVSTEAMPGGVLGRALDFVQVPAEYARVAENLLGNIMIVRDLAAALSLRAGGSGRFLYVTLGGDVIDPSGAVIVGEEKGIFRRQREIRELDGQIADKKSAIDRMSEEVRRLQETIAQKEAGISEVQAMIHTFEKEISLSRLTIDNFMEDKERTSRKIAYLNIELEEMEREKSSLQSSMAAADARLRDRDAHRAAKEKILAELQESIGQRKAELEAQRAEATDLKLQAASARERLDAAKNERETSARTLEELRQKRDGLAAEIEAVLGRISQRREEISGHDERLRKLVADAGILRQDISVRRERIDQENEDLMAVEHDLKGTRQELSSITARLSEIEAGRAGHAVRLENLVTNTHNNYGVAVADIELSEVLPEEENRLVELRGKLQEIGPVNLGTLEEYEELMTRYEFLTKQHEDLNKSIAELEEAIAKINTTTRKKLREAYDSLRQKFAEVFVSLFGGGRAELILTDENNILESGVDIIAQPPGKKIQNIHLLSGGEQALTALSLQFASFLIKPTPLCILDEADAPLDESNTERYARMLTELSKETQFIVVTHNRTTMAAAQHLYGITMEEAGVSKVISMQLAGV